ncbi:MgpC family cytadherence protein [Mycoplasmoides genitalium]|uniref:MgpC family cytadherence protein n=1 Tax=Mycoplasmoides genitalium TaxID=2097 RepID=UPI0038CDBB1A
MGEGNSNAGKQDTFSFVVPYSDSHSNQTSSGTIKTAYPVKSDQKSSVAINSLINATPLNSYGTIKKLPVNKKQVVNYLSN